MNKRQRRAEAHERAYDPEHAEQQLRKTIDPATPPDVMSPRATSTGHGKKTADKWNQ